VTVLDRARRAAIAVAMLATAGCGGGEASPDAGSQDAAEDLDSQVRGGDASDRDPDAGPDARSSGASGLILTPTPWDFGEVELGGSSASATFTVRNLADVAASPISVTIRGVDAEAFVAVPGSDGCSGAALAPGASCSLDVVFAPTWPGRLSALLEITTAEGATHASFAGTALDVAAPIALDRDAYDFGAAGVTCAGTTIEVVLTEVGIAPSGPITIGIEGSDASSFAVVTTTCDAGLEPGESCRASVRFSPIAARVFMARLKVSFATGTLEVPLMGTGTEGCAEP